MVEKESIAGVGKKGKKGTGIEGEKGWSSFDISSGKAQQAEYLDI
jgi:hypothetical protein